MNDDQELLRQFARGRAGDAFAEIVRRRLALVYSAALRQVNGDAHLAQDVTQSVFISLARKANALAGHRTLVGWLYTSTHHAAANVVRAERRRRKREEEAQVMQELTNENTHDAAWMQIRPVLDQAMQSLSRDDREAVLLRFFEGWSFAELGALFKVTENGARMRVERALERLRVQLSRRGIQSVSAALGAALASSQAVAIPPAALASAVTTAAIASTTGAVAGSGILGFIYMTKIQTTIIAAVVLAGAGMLGVQLAGQKQLRSLIKAQHANAARPAQERNDAPSHETMNDERIQALLLEADELRQKKEEAGARLRQLAGRSAVAPANAGASVAASGIADANQVYNLRDLDQQPTPIGMRAEPSYPYEMKRLGYPGEAALTFVVTTEGSVSDIEVMRATDPEFALAAMEAVMQWKFRPGRKGGRKVNARLTLPISFDLSDTDKEWF